MPMGIPPHLVHSAATPNALVKAELSADGGELNGGVRRKGKTFKALLDWRGGLAYGCRLEGDGNGNGRKELSQGRGLGNH